MLDSAGGGFSHLTRARRLDSSSSSQARPDDDAQRAGCGQARRHGGTRHRRHVEADDRRGTGKPTLGAAGRSLAVTGPRDSLDRSSAETPRRRLHCDDCHARDNVSAHGRGRRQHRPSGSRGSGQTLTFVETFEKTRSTFTLTAASAGSLVDGLETCGAYIVLAFVDPR
jgi:hypothetical protein